MNDLIMRLLGFKYKIIQAKTEGEIHGYQLVKVLIKNNLTIKQFPNPGVFSYYTNEKIKTLGYCKKK